MFHWKILIQIMQDCNAADMELESRNARVSNNHKLLKLLHDNGNLFLGKRETNANKLHGSFI